MLLQSMPLAVNKYLFATLPFDPVADLAPVSLICDYPNFMVVPTSSPAKSVQEFIAYAKANPGKANYASSGHGTSVHLSRRAVQQMTGLKLQHIPYRGAGPALNDLIPGRVDVMFNDIGAVMPLIQGGQLRALGVTSAKRAANCRMCRPCPRRAFQASTSRPGMRCSCQRRHRPRSSRNCTPTRLRRSPIPPPRRGSSNSASA